MGIRRLYCVPFPSRTTSLTADSLGISARESIGSAWTAHVAGELPNGEAGLFSAEYNYLQI